MMTPEHKLVVALQLVEELSNLIEGNEYEQFFTQHLIQVDFELKRQLTNLQFNTTIKE
jgi:predicted RNA-binding protein with EMAP domain